MDNLFLQIGSYHVCDFPKATTIPIVFFEYFIIIATIIVLWFLYKQDKKNIKRFLLITAGVFVFEFFTAPMWNNWHMGKCAYVYHDVSWVLTIGWSILILTVVHIIDIWFKKWREWQRFLLYLGILSVVVFFLEVLVVNIGIRSYSPEVLSTVVGIYLWRVPIETFYYVPVFIALVIGFYKYWNFVLEKKLLVPVKRKNLLRSFIFALLAVFLFELMVEPMVVNAKLPEWSYFYRDISLIMSGFWVLVIWLSTSLVDRFFIHWSLSGKFVMYLFFTEVLALPLEAFFIKTGIRVYGESAVNNFSGFMFPFLYIPVEIAFAIPLYMALLIAFIRYWEIVNDNNI